MGLFKKTNIISEEDKGDKTPVKFSRHEKLQEGEKKKKKWPKRVIISAVILLMVGAISFFGVKAYLSVRDIFADNGGGVLNLFNGSTATPLKGEKDGRVNVLLIGVGDEGHSGSTLADTIMIASYDVKTKSVAMFSIPRDTYVKIPGNGSTKINAAHAYGEEKGKGQGPDLLSKTVTENFGPTIHYYVRVDFSGLKDIVDALGGITVNVENTFCDYNYPTELKGDTSKVCFTAGQQQMNGVKALQYSRSRHALGVEGSDFARSKRQQRVLLAIKEKALSGSTVFNPKKVLDLMSALGKHLKTNFGTNDFARLFELSKGVDTSQIITKNFDNSPTGYMVSDSSTTAGYILVPKTGNWKEIQGVIKNIFAEAVVKTEKANVAVLNGTWSTGLAKTVADDLKAVGYNVVYSGDATNRTTAKTQIIDMTDGKKPETVKALENRFGVTATKQSADGSGYEIKVIIGRDYK
jgi:LCP family protein required for cell wall assembly